MYIIVYHALNRTQLRSSGDGQNLVVFATSANVHARGYKVATKRLQSGVSGLRVLNRRPGLPPSLNRPQSSRTAANVGAWFGPCRVGQEGLAETPTRKTPVLRASCATTCDLSRGGYFFRANVPRAAFTNRASLPLRMSRRIEAYNVCRGVLPPGLAQ